jgi:DNA polymerase-1
LYRGCGARYDAPVPRTFYLIDGHAQIYRAYYAPFGNLSAPSGEPTRATHVFCQMVLNLVRNRKPDYLAMAVDDVEERVFRREIYPLYKANRQPPPEDLPIQAQRIMSILSAVGVPILRVPRFEADDIMATLAARLAGPDLHIYFVSRDKDLEQLLCDYVFLYDPAKDEVITPQRLRELKGWGPEQAIEAQILMGDSVDNVPGVAGIGPKNAARLLAQYGTAAEVIAHADELPPRQRDSARAFAPQLELVRRLVTLRKDVPLEFDLEQAACSRLSWSAAAPIMEELGLRRLRELLPADQPVPARTPEPTTAGDKVPAAAAAEACAGTLWVWQPQGGDYRLINTIDAFKEFCAELARQREFAVDTETTGVNPVDADLVGLSFSWRAGTGYYVPVRSALGPALPLELVREGLGPLLCDEGRRKVGHNLKYDLIVLRNAGLGVKGPLFDTMIAAFVVDPTRSSYSLDRLALGLLGHQMIPITDLIGQGRNQLCIDQVPLTRVTEYAAEDADYTWRLRELLEPRLSELAVDKLFYQIEMPLVSVLSDMEYHGVRIDVDYLRQMGRQMAAQMEELRRQIHAAVGMPFNLDSPKQLAEVLFDRLGFRVVKRTRTARSTDAETLETLARETGHPVPGLLLQYRELQKLRSTYVEALPAAISRRTGRIHTSYHQTGAVTGRLSSSEPNLQNIPVRTELGRQIRRAFIPRSADERLIVADYSQVELRVLAHFCQDEGLLRAFAEDRDIHAFVAAEVNGVPLEAVTRQMRERAKAVNFGIIYGQSAFGLAQTTGMSRTEAQDFIDKYFRRYPRIRAFIDECIAAARRDGFVRTIQGRRRPIPDIASRNAAARAAAERLAVNTVIQGSAADLIKTAMIRLHERIQRQNLPLRMLLQVHDELVCEGPQDQVAELAAIVREEMAGAMQLRVPLKVDVAWGNNWLEAKGAA